MDFSFPAHWRVYLTRLGVSRCFNRIFGPFSLLIFFILLKKAYNRANPYVNPQGIDGQLYLALHTISLFLALAFFGVFFLRFLKWARRKLRRAWDSVTPPFRQSLDDKTVEIDREKVIKAYKISAICIGSGIYGSVFFPILGFVPWPNGTMVTPFYRAYAPSVTVPDFLHQFPIISDLSVLGDYVFSPDALGYLLISIVVGVMIIGFWNLTYIFSNKDRIIEEIDGIPLSIEILLRWLPFLGVALFTIVVLEFGFTWFR